jgi:hypothetical protein
VVRTVGFTFKMSEGEDYGDGDDYADEFEDVFEDDDVRRPRMAHTHPRASSSCARLAMRARELQHEDVACLGSHDMRLSRRNRRRVRERARE